MDYRNDFPESLKVANMYEEWFAEKFMTKHNYKLNNDNRYDIITDEGVTVEIKHDYQSKNGNIAVEWFCRDKPSCISVTEAYWYVFIYPLINEIWMIKTNTLKKRIKDYKEGIYNDNYTSDLFFTYNAPGGDVEYGRKVSKLHLMKREDNRDIFRVIRCEVPKF